MTRRRIVLLILGLAILGAGLFAWRAKAARAPALQLETARVERGRIEAKVTATGTLSALVTVQVGSQVSGRIQALYADFNSVVKKGELVAKIDPQLFQASVAQAKANLVAAQGNLAKARAQALDAMRQYARSKALAEEKLIARAELDTAESNAAALAAQVEAAMGSVEQARAALNSAEVNLAYTDIVSPTNGVVISRSVDVGQTVAASLQAPTLFVIAEDLSKMQVDTSVAESDVGRLTPGMDVTFSVDAYPSKVFRGKVRQIRNAPQTVQNVVTYDAVVDVGNPELELKPGMTANVTFIYAEKDDVLRVPNAGLRFKPPPELLARSGAGGAALAASGGPVAAGSKSAQEGSTGRSGAVRAGAPGGVQGPSGGPQAGGTAGARSQEPGQGGAAGGRRGAAPGERTVWVVRPDGPAPVTVKTGISDGVFTEVSEGALAPGDEVVTDTSGSSSARPGGMAGHRRPF